jgi:hypothetical protein
MVARNGGTVNLDYRSTVNHYWLRASGLLRFFADPVYALFSLPGSHLALFLPLPGFRPAAFLAAVAFVFGIQQGAARADLVLSAVTLGYPPDRPLTHRTHLVVPVPYDDHPALSAPGQVLA